MAEYKVQDTSLASVADAIREKAGSSDDLAFPAGFIEAITGISAGGGNIIIKQGTVTFETETQSYDFVDDAPDIFICYVENELKNVYSSANYVWAFMQDKRAYSSSDYTQYTFGRNKGSSKYYVPYVGGVKATQLGKFSTTTFNGILGATKYRWIAIYGIGFIE